MLGCYDRLTGLALNRMLDVTSWCRQRQLCGLETLRPLNRASDGLSLLNWLSEFVSEGLKLTSLRARSRMQCSKVPTQRLFWQGYRSLQCSRRIAIGRAANITPAISSTHDGVLPCYGGKCTLCGDVHYIPCTPEAAAHGTSWSLHTAAGSTA